jgi:hypothetical protein
MNRIITHEISKLTIYRYPEPGKMISLKIKRQNDRYGLKNKGKQIQRREELVQNELTMKIAGKTSVGQFLTFTKNLQFGSNK